MKAGDLIKKLADKTGADLTALEAEITQQLSAIDIDDALAEKISNSLLTANEAKNSPDIKSHFYANFADGFDRQLDDSFKSLGLTDEVIAELKASEPKTSKRTSLYAAKVSELQKELAKSQGKGNDEKALKLAEDLKDAQSQLRASIDTNTKLVTDHLDKEIDWRLGSELSNYELKKSIPSEYKSEIASRAVKDFLKTNDAKMVLENGVLKLKRASDSSLEVTDFDLKTALNKSLSEKDLIETAIAASPSQPVIVEAGNKGSNYQSENFRKAAEMMNH